MSGMYTVQARGRAAIFHVGVLRRCQRRREAAASKVSVSDRDGERDMQRGDLPGR